MQSRIAESDYLIEIAKDWTVSCFASARRSGFTLVPHRFELTRTGVRRRRVKPGSVEALSPLDAIRNLSEPIAWSHPTFITLLVDSDSETRAVEQEVVEVLAVEGGVVLAEAAAVIRIPGLPPCLGAFGAPE